MKGVDTIARIRREFFIRGCPSKEIVSELHVSRNTVRKVVRSGATVGGVIGVHDRRTSDHSCSPCRT
jgi:orotate phosphoribosyltransferase-like protein